MGYIAAFFVERYLAHIPDDVNKDDALKRVGLSELAQIDPVHMVRDTEFFDFLEFIVSQSETSRPISVEVGETMRCDDYGAFGLAFKTAVTLLSSFRRVERFGQVVTSLANFSVREEPDHVFMEVHPGDTQRLGLHMTNELAVAAAVSLCREVCSERIDPVLVSFSHTAPSSAKFYEAYFNCSVQFNTGCDGFALDRETANKTNRLGDQKTSEFVDLHLDKELAALKNDSGLEQRVRIQIASALSEGVPVISDIAGQLGMSGRSLQRRLSERGCAFQDIVDDARRELAEKLLRGTAYSLAEVAFLTGYSEQSTFTKAFKRWRGMTPRSYRLEIKPPT